jgi:hypothetical protein
MSLGATGLIMRLLLIIKIIKMLDTCIKIKNEM